MFQVPSGSEKFETSNDLRDFSLVVADLRIPDAASMHQKPDKFPIQEAESNEQLFLTPRNKIDYELFLEDRGLNCWSDRIRRYRAVSSD